MKGKRCFLGLDMKMTELRKRQRPGEPIISLAVSIFVFVILFILPFIYDHYYFNILETKYYTYCIAAAALIFIWLVYALLQLGKKKPGKVSFNLKVFSAADGFLLLFLLVSLVSTIFSSYSYEAFWGNEGRYTGLFLWSLYGAAFFIISRYGRLTERHIHAFLAMGLFVCIFGITDYFQMDLLGFKAANMAEEDKRIYFSTIGNINTYTTYVALVMAVSTILFTKSSHRKWMLFYYITSIISFLAIITGESDNSYLSIGTLFLFSPLYLFRYREGIKRYLITVITFLASVKLIDWINEAAGDLVYGIDSLFNYIAEFKYLTPIIIILILITAGWYIFNWKKGSEEAAEPGRILTLGWLGLCIAVFAVLFFVIYDVNISGNGERYGSLSYYLLFNDSWGTNRGYIWKSLLSVYQDFSFGKKLIGFGPDTFLIVMVTHFREEMTSVYNVYFDSAHNEYLQYLITVGAVGMTAYIGFICSSLFRMVKLAKEEPFVMAIVFAILCYSAQAIVNISVPVVAPVMLTLLMLGLAYSNNRLE